MATIDYGAILRKDEEVLNHNLFMETSDTGFMYKEVNCKNSDRKLQIDGNYFVYAGDEHYMVVFYKCMYHIISEGKIIYTQYHPPFIKETMYFEGLPTFTIKHLDPNLYSYVYGEISEFDKQYFFSRFGKKRGLQIIYRIAKGRCRNKKKNKTMTNRWIATWEHNGHKYEVIFGYGVDPDKEIWNDIKFNYGFTDIERNLIDKWLNEGVDIN